MITELPYRLHAHGEFLCATGPTDALELIQNSVTPIIHEGWWWLPATDVNCLLLEALYPVSEATDQYRETRHRLLGSSPEILNLTNTWLLNAQLNPDDYADYQKISIYLGAVAGRLYNGSEPGTGKTRVALALLAIWQCQRTLILATSSGMDEWVREASKITFPNFIIHMLTGSVLERSQQLKDLANQSQPFLAIGSYGSFSGDTRKRVKKGRLSLLNAALGANLHCLVLDESWKVNSPDSKWTQQLLVLSASVPRIQELSGTPVGNSARDLWSQLRILGAIDDSLEDFEANHVIFETFQLGTRKLKRPKSGKRIGELLARVKHCWFRVIQEGVLDDLPAKQEPITVTLEMAPNHRQLYDQLKSEGLAALGLPHDLSAKPVVDIRLCQLCGGSVPFWTETGEQQVWRSEDDTKLAWIRQKVQDTWLGDRSRRGIIWCRFNQDVARVTELLRSLGIIAVAVTGPEENFDLIEDPLLGLTVSQVKDSFNSRSPTGVQVIVAQWSKLCSSANLQAGDDVIQYTSTWSYIEWTQASYRNRRRGRTTASFCYYLVYRDSKDEDVLAALYAKQDFALQVEGESYRELAI